MKVWARFAANVALVYAVAFGALMLILGVSELVTRALRVVLGLEFLP